MSETLTPAEETPSRSLTEMVRSLLHNKSGTLTRELLRKPGGFGLGQVPVKLAPDTTTDAVCGYCSTGCGLKLHLRDGEAVSLSPTTNYPVNLGMACPKGWEALTVLDAPDRATTPLLKNERGQQTPVDWETALTTFCTRMKATVEKHGPESIAFLSTGQIPSEEMAFLGSLFKFGMGGIHGDGNTRQCMATAVTAYKQSFGFDAPPYTYRDFEESDVLVFVGSNVCIAHPIMWERVMRNPHAPEIVVIDPRTTETAMQATQHLPVAPKADQTLLYGLARILIENDWLDRAFIEAHTSDFDAFAEFVQPFTLDRVADETGLERAAILKLARTIHEGKRVSFWWTMGVNQSHQGTRTAQAIINLALMTGNIGRPGTGANSITGQCNAMGSRLFSNTTNLLGGHAFESAADRKKIAGILGIPVERIPDRLGKPYNEIVEDILRGKIKALWVIATNPAHSWTNLNTFDDILSRLDFLVVQDMYTSTETARQADLLLPAAGWGEKAGTFINSERRFGLLKKVRKAPGQALADFHIFQLIAHYWGCGELFERWTDPEAAFDLLKQFTEGQPCDITGIDGYAMLDREGGVQWPHRAEDASPPERERRLFTDGTFHHDDGKAKFLFEAPKPLPERTTEKYPLTLLTGRGTASQWHTQTRTSKSAVLRKLYPQTIYVEMNPRDAQPLGIGPNTWVVIETQRGQIRAKTFLTRSVRVGQIFIPMHYDTTNRLTDAVFDPYSKQPAYKACAVRVTPAP